MAYFLVSCLAGKWKQLRLLALTLHQVVKWTSELDIDALEAKGHWATLEELLEVVGRYLPRYESVLKSCKEKPGAVLPIDLSFATKFLAVYLFIKVKGSRPMTYQYLTVEMVNKAKTNGGFID